MNIAARQQVVEMHLAGRSLRRIAEELGSTLAIVRKVLADEGHTVAPTAAQEAVRASKAMSDARWERAERAAAERSRRRSVAGELEVGIHVVKTMGEPRVVVRALRVGTGEVLRQYSHPASIDPTHLGSLLLEILSSAANAEDWRS